MPDWEEKVHMQRCATRRQAKVIPNSSWEKIDDRSRSRLSEANNNQEFPLKSVSHRSRIITGIAVVVSNITCDALLLRELSRAQDPGYILI
jgi:hypothetical protein